MATMRERIIRARLDKIEQQGTEHEIALIEIESIHGEIPEDQYDNLVSQHESELNLCEKRRVALLDALTELLEPETADMSTNSPKNLNETQHQAYDDLNGSDVDDLETGEDVEPEHDLDLSTFIKEGE